jgi:hypothetical protein
MTARPAARATAANRNARHEGANLLSTTPRSTAMLLINEDLARARMREREADGANARLALVALSARKRDKRAKESAARQARLANAV